MNETLTNADGSVQVNIVRDERGKITGIVAWERVDLIAHQPAQPFDSLSGYGDGSTVSVPVKGQG